MRSDIDHLPPIQQDELERVKQLLMAEFAEAISRATQPWKKNGKILKIILFGSYSRDDWVDEPANGYQSDFDLLIIVSHEDLTDIADYWYLAEDKIQRDAAIARPVNIIVHTFDEVNRALSRGEYFWVEIARDGIVLYELPGNALATPMPLTAADAYEMAFSYYGEQSRSLIQWIELVDYSVGRIAADPSWSKKAAFNLHQAVETEPRRVCRRLQLLRRWSLYEQDNEQVCAGSPRAGGADGGRSRARLSLPLGSGGVDRGEDRLRSADAA